MSTITELNQTIILMNSDDYKDRFKAEYYQLMIRYIKLMNMIVKYDTGTLDFTPNCPIDILENQAEAMKTYLRTLKKRAELEGIIL